MHMICRQMPTISTPQIPSQRRPRSLARPALNQPPYESERAQKLNKEKKKRPTHTPVGYRPILLQVIYLEQDRPKHRDEIRPTQETELHRSRCNPGVFRLKMLCIFWLIPPHPPINPRREDSRKTGCETVKRETNEESASYRQNRATLQKPVNCGASRQRPKSRTRTVTPIILSTIFRMVILTHSKPRQSRPDASPGNFRR
jgi:hypothetical protein